MAHRNFVGFALVGLILLSTSVLQAKCSLAAYSETRSFRDALDGRSMEEAMSGPVDGDTSSYGDRTSSSSATTGAQAPAAAPMMLNIPANGNLGQQQVDEPQQMQMRQKSFNKANDELEREAGPIGEGSPMDGQQKLMEQKQQVGRQVAQTARNLAGRYMQMQRQNSAQQQQQQIQRDISNGLGSSKGGANNEQTGFGEEPREGVKQGGSGKKGGEEAGSPSYSSNRQQVEQSKQQPANGNQSGDEQQLMNGNEQQQQDRELSSGGESDLQQQAVKQRAMAAMLMSMNNAMKYSQQQQQQQQQRATGTKLMSSTTQSPIMQPIQQQVTVPDQAFTGEQAKGKGASTQQQQQQQLNSAFGQEASMFMQNQQMQPTRQVAGKLRASSGPSGRGGMRRASQRKVEKKMSPSMVNAMLNKMLNLKPSGVDANNKEQSSYVKPAAMAMLMKSPAGAELLANMAMGPQVLGAMAGMPASKKEQYKRMMMAAIMQQVASNSETAADSPDVQQQDDSYSPSQMSSNMPTTMNTAGTKSASPGTGGYSQGNMAAQDAPATMSPVAMMMNAVMNAEKAPASGFGYEQQNLADQQQQQVNGDDTSAMMMTTTTRAPDNYANRMNSGSKNSANSMVSSTMAGYSSMMKMKKMMNMNGFGEQQQQMMIGSSPGNKGDAGMKVKMSKPLMSPAALGNSMGYSQMNSLVPTPMVSMSDAMGMSSRGGMRGSSGTSRYSGKQQQQQQQQQMNDIEGDLDQQQESMYSGKMNQGSMNSMEQATSGKQAGGMPMNSYAPPSGGMIGKDNSNSNNNNNVPLTMMMLMNSLNSPRQNGFQQMGAGRKQAMPSNSYGSSSSNSDSYGSGTAKGARMNAQMPMPMSMSIQPIQQQVQQNILGNQDESTGSMPSPMQVPRPRPVQMSFGGSGSGNEEGASKGAVEQQQVDEFGGAAPMGMAEPFAFDYKVEDDYGNGHYRKEESDKNGVVRGSYGYMDVNGLYRHVDYVADENGFRANVKSNEPGLSSETSSATSASSNSGNSANSGDSQSTSAPDSQSQTQMPSQMMMSMDAPTESTTPAIQQQQQQQMLPTQMELNENGSK